MSSVKCPQCGLVNFADAEKCKRCDADLSESVKADQGEAVPQSQEGQKQNLYPCPDCERMISRSAEACPHCGRFIQRLGAMTVNQAGWKGTIAWGILLSGVLLIAITTIFWVVIFFLFFAASRPPR